MKVYIYVTKGGKTLVESNGVYSLVKKSDLGLNGKVVACFDCNEIEDLKAKPKDGHFYEVLKKACLTAQDLEHYCPTNSKKGLFAWKIENLKRFCAPLLISDFVASKMRKNPKLTDVWPICKAPQSWCYSVGHVAIYMKEGDFEGFKSVEDSVILSIRPEWACKSLNGEKTYEIRTTKPKEAL